MSNSIAPAFITLLLSAGVVHSLTGQTEKEPDPTQLCIIAGTAKFVITAKTGDIDMLVRTCDGSIARFRMNIRDYINPKKKPDVEV